MKMTHIKLGIIRLGISAGKVKYTIIDENDINMVKNLSFEPRVDIEPNGQGARVLAYVYNILKGKKAAKCLHNVLWEKYKGKIPKGYQVYHKNGITVDNRLENLGLTKHFKFKRTDTR